MVESQCPTCGHCVTGFERQQFEADRAIVEALKGHIAQLLNQLALQPVKHPQQAAQRDAARAAIEW